MEETMTFDDFCDELKKKGWHPIDDAQLFGARLIFDKWFPLQSKIEYLKQEIRYLEDKF
jgi:hypothetical protein